MLSKEKIIKGLETIVTDEKMWRKSDYYADIAKNALELIKNQQKDMDAFLVKYNDLLEEKLIEEREWRIEKRKGDRFIQTDLICACGSQVYYDEILFRDGGTANRLFCVNCGLSMRSPGNDVCGEWLKHEWKTIIPQRRKGKKR